MATWLRAAAGSEGLREVSRRVLGRVSRVPSVGEAAGVMDQLGSGRQLGRAGREAAAAMQGVRPRPRPVVDAALGWVEAEAGRFHPAPPVAPAVLHAAAADYVLVRLSVAPLRDRALRDSPQWKMATISAPLMKTNSFDHVALWVNDPQAIADFLDPLEGMHVIEQTADFTLIGGDAREGKLTLFAAEGERGPGVIGRIVLRVPDLEQALAALDGVEMRAAPRRRSPLHRPRGHPVRAGRGRRARRSCDLDHVVLRVTGPRSGHGAGLATLGLEPDATALRLANRRVIARTGPAARAASRC